MFWRCDSCDKNINDVFRDNHLQSQYHKRLANLIIRKQIFTNPKPNKIDYLIRKYFILHYRKYEKFLPILSVKLILPSNQIKYIRRRQKCSFNDLAVKNSSFFSKNKINNEQLYSQILELRITFFSRFDNITLDHYITKSKSMLEWKLVAMFDKNPKTARAFDYRKYNRLFFQDFHDIFLR